MKRPLLVLVLSLTILGTLAAYSRFVATLPVQAVEKLTANPTNDDFILELQFSCPLAADPFELDQATSLLVRCAGQELFRSSEPLSVTEPLRLEHVRGLQEGRNAIFIHAIPAAESLSHPQAVRVQVFRNQERLVDVTRWSVAGEPLEGEITFLLAASAGETP